MECKNNWKEKEEHQFVLDYIVSQIKNQENGIILKNFSVSDTYTIKAGNLLHLKADIKGTISDFELKSLLDTLHPTPAVCGLPKAAAKDFILQNENYDRCYYTGFLGEINTNLMTSVKEHDEKGLPFKEWPRHWFGTNAARHQLTRRSLIRYNLNSFNSKYPFKSKFAQRISPELLNENRKIFN